MDIENVVIERAHRTGKENKNRSRSIVAQFSFYKDKMNILKNCKKSKNTRFSIFEDLERQLGEGIIMYIHDSLNFKSQRDLDINTKNVESLSIELISKNSKKTGLSTIYRPPDGDFKAFNTFLEDIYSISLESNNVPGDFNLNVLDYNKNEKVTKFLNLTFEHGLVPVISKPTRVTKNTATAIDHIVKLKMT